MPISSKVTPIFKQGPCRPSIVLLTNQIKQSFAGPFNHRYHEAVKIPANTPKNSPKSVLSSPRSREIGSKKQKLPTLATLPENTSLTGCWLPFRQNLAIRYLWPVYRASPARRKIENDKCTCSYQLSIEIHRVAPDREDANFFLPHIKIFREERQST